MANGEIRSTARHAAAAGPAGAATPPGDRPADPAALTAEQLARMLGVPAAKVREHLAAGAPAGAGGTINLVHYTAWLIGQLASSDGDGDEKTAD